jgi:hypothetical protein
VPGTIQAWEAPAGEEMSVLVQPVGSVFALLGEVRWKRVRRRVWEGWGRCILMDG